MATVATMTAPSLTLASTKSSKFQLLSLLKDCMQHLEQSDEYSPIIYQTSNKLHEYADTQAKVLQTQLLQLKQERDEALKQSKALHKQQKSLTNVEMARPQGPTTSTAKPKLSAFEQQKRAAAEKRRQQVIEQRRKAALEQKRKEEDQKRKFLDKERRKEQLKVEAAKQAAQNKAKASLTQEKRIQQDAISELDKIGGRDSFEKQEESQFPQSPSPIQRSTSSSTASTPISSPSPTQRSAPVASPTIHAKIPDLAAARPPVPQPATRRQSSSSSASSIPTQAQQHHQENHASTGTDRKYSTMSYESSVTAKETNEESPSFDSTELKRQILIQWGLQPPDYQMLKRIDQLVATIQNVYPPFAGVPSHSYFDGWKAVHAAEFIRYGEHGIAELDFDKLKKAVRRVRVFLHPDKLPKDFSEAQIFVCKLLWDVTNDALEDFKIAEAARRGR